MLHGVNGGLRSRRRSELAEGQGGRGRGTVGRALACPNDHGGLAFVGLYVRLRARPTAKLSLADSCSLAWPCHRIPYRATTSNFGGSTIVLFTAHRSAARCTALRYLSGKSSGSRTSIRTLSSLCVTG